MTKKKRPRQDDSEYVRGGKGRRDEIGKTGVHPASAGSAPADAVPRGQEELGHVSPRGEAMQVVPKPEEEQQNAGREHAHGQEHDPSVRDREIRRETQTNGAMGRLAGSTTNPPESEDR